MVKKPCEGIFGMGAVKKIDAREPADDAAVAGEAAFPDHDDLGGVRHEIGEIIKKHLTQSCADYGADEYVLNKEYEVVFGDVFFFQYPAAKEEAAEDGECPHQAVPLHRKKMKGEWYIGVYIPVDEHQHGSRIRNFLLLNGTKHRRSMVFERANAVKYCQQMTLRSFEFFLAFLKE